MGMTPNWLSRQCVAFVMLSINVIFLIIALTLPWYSIIQKNVPYPTYTNNTVATIVGVFYWTGYSTAVSPNYTSAFVANRGWNAFPTDGPKNIYMISMALTILALIGSMVLAFFVLVAAMMKNSRRWFDLVCFGKTRWVLFGSSLLIVGLIFLAWVIFFVFPTALGKDGTICPNPNYVGNNIGLWCSSFVGANVTVGRLGSQYAWAPSVGWVFAVFSMVWALGAAFFLFIVKPADYYEKVGESGSDRRGTGYDDGYTHPMQAYNEKGGYDGGYGGYGGYDKGGYGNYKGGY